MLMKTGNKIRPLYGPNEDDWIPGDDFDFVPKSSPSESEKVVPFNQPLDAIAMGVQLVQVFPMLQQISQQVSVLTAKMERLERQRLSPPPRSDFDEVAYLDAEGARKYLSMSKNSFEKHVYLAKVKIPRYLVGGKNLFKKADLDRFVQAWEDKNRS
jgi:hypothetical protein